MSKGGRLPRGEVPRPPRDPSRAEILVFPPSRYLARGNLGANTTSLSDSEDYFLRVILLLCSVSAESIELIVWIIDSLE